jgi:hypothetical protein
MCIYLPVGGTVVLLVGDLQVGVDSLGVKRADGVNIVR